MTEPLDLAMIRARGQRAMDSVSAGTIFALCDEIDRLRAEFESKRALLALSYGRERQTEPVLDAAKELMASTTGLDQQRSIDAWRSFESAVRALVASEAKTSIRIVADESIAQGAMALVDINSGSVVIATNIAAQGASCLEAEGGMVRPLTHPASALLAEARASIALDKGEDRTRNMDDASGEEEV